MPFYMYNKDGAKLFNDNETAPSGYFDCPTKAAAATEKPTVKKEQPVKKTNTNKKG